MLIEFRIQTDDNGGVNVVQAQATPNPSSPAQKELGVVFGGNPGAALAKAQKGAGQPVDDTGTGKPPAVASLLPSSGTGSITVIGPIIVCGSGPGHTGPGGGGQPVDDTGTGKPKAVATSPAQNDAPPTTEAPYPAKRKQARKKR